MIRIPNNYYRISSAGRAPLRTGLLLDSVYEIPAFTATIIEDIKASNFAGIELLIVRKAKATAASDSDSRGSGLLRHLSNPQLRKHLLYDLYLRLDARMKPANDPLANVDGKDLLAGIETVHVEMGEDFAHPFPADALEQIRAKDLDVLIRFGFNHLSGGILNVARYGV